MLNPFDGIEIIKQFIPPHKQIEIQDRIVDALARAFPNGHLRKLIQAYHSDAAFQDALMSLIGETVLVDNGMLTIEEGTLTLF